MGKKQIEGYEKETGKYMIHSKQENEDEIYIQHTLWTHRFKPA